MKYAEKDAEGSLSFLHDEGSSEVQRTPRATRKQGKWTSPVMATGPKGVGVSVTAADEEVRPRKWTMNESAESC